MDIIFELSRKESECVCPESDLWLISARELLRWNSINIYVFADALKNCLEKGRQKNNNILLTGPTNCGK